MRIALGTMTIIIALGSGGCYSCNIPRTPPLTGQCCQDVKILIDKYVKPTQLIRR